MEADYLTALAKAFKRMRDCFKNLCTFIRKKWDSIKQFLSTHKPHYKMPTHPAAKRTMDRVSIIHSQVILRKPKLIRARTSC